MKSTTHYWVVPENLICGPHFPRMWKVARGSSHCEQAAYSPRQRDLACSRVSADCMGIFLTPCSALKNKMRHTSHISDCKTHFLLISFLFAWAFHTLTLQRLPLWFSSFVLFFFLLFDFASLKEKEISELYPWSQEQIFCAHREGWLCTTYLGATENRTELMCACVAYPGLRQGWPGSIVLMGQAMGV